MNVQGAGPLAAGIAARPELRTPTAATGGLGTTLGGTAGSALGTAAGLRVPTPALGAGGATAASQGDSTLAGTLALLIQRLVPVGGEVAAVGSPDGTLARTLAVVRPGDATTRFLALPTPSAAEWTPEPLLAALDDLAARLGDRPLTALLLGRDFQEQPPAIRASILGALAPRLAPGGRLIAVAERPPARGMSDVAAFLDPAGDGRLPRLRLAEWTAGVGSAAHLPVIVLERPAPWLADLALPQLAVLVARPLALLGRQSGQRRRARPLAGYYRLLRRRGPPILRRLRDAARWRVGSLINRLRQRLLGIERME